MACKIRNYHANKYSSHSKIDGAGELNYLAESSGLNKLISPDSKNIKNLERKLTNKKDLMQIRKNYLELQALMEKKNLHLF